MLGETGIPKDTEVLNLQTENRDLRKELDELKKKLDALTISEPAGKKKTSARPQR